MPLNSGVYFTHITHLNLDEPHFKSSGAIGDWQETTPLASPGPETRLVTRVFGILAPFSNISGDDESRRAAVVESSYMSTPESSCPGSDADA